MRVQKYNFFHQIPSLLQKKSPIPSILLISRAYTNKKSDKRFINASNEGHTGTSSDRAMMRRSARRHTVRHTWHWEAAMHPPGRIKERSGATCASHSSISRSKRLTCSSEMPQAASSPSGAGMARCVPTSNMRDCSQAKRVAVSFPYPSRETWRSPIAATMDANRPRWALSSSTVPYASSRLLHFFTRLPPISDVVPASPPRVYIRLFFVSISSCVFFSLRNHRLSLNATQ